MNMQEVKAIALKQGVKSGSMRKAELIQSIQAAEGNDQCFGIGKKECCGQDECLWKADCN